MLSSISVENAATIFHAADVHSAKGLREKVRRRKATNAEMAFFNGASNVLSLGTYISSLFSQPPYFLFLTPTKTHNTLPLHLLSSSLQCLNFILANFEMVSKSKSFEEMARVNVELVLTILKLR